MASSPLYKAPVTIGESCTFKAAALREGMQTPVYTRKFDFNKATGRRIALNAAPTLKYTYGGASLLVGQLPRRSRLFERRVDRVP